MVERAIKIVHNGEVGWKLSRKLYLLKTKMNNLFWIKNNCIKELAIEDKVYRKLERENRQFIHQYSVQASEHRINKTVWICWMQGLENAPELVKACVRSIREKLKDFEIIIISEVNIKQYLHLPEHILKKYRKGIITNTHFSDIIRISLLAEYGGLWLDSTVLCTDDTFANYIITLPLFVYKEVSLDRSDELPIFCSNWLISAQPNHPILMLTRDLIYKYWGKYNYPKHYFFFHLFFSMAAKRFRDEWEQIPVYNNRSPHTLMFELDKPFDPFRWKEIEKISSFHKLTRHIDFENNNTNYGHIISSFGRQRNENESIPN